jgi:uncharacterized protein YkwD
MKHSGGRAAAGCGSVVTICAVLLSGCGGSDTGPSPPQGAIGSPAAASNQRGSGVVVPAGEAPHAGVVEGAPDQEAPNRLPPPDEQALADGTGSCGATTAVPSQSTIAVISQSILCLLNVERTTRGLVALRSNQRLARASVGHSSDMVRHMYFGHDTPQGVSLLDRVRSTGYLKSRSDWTVGENIAWGSGTLGSAQALVDAWMKSPPHRANILQRRYREIGVGLVLGAPTPGVSGVAVTATTDFGRVISQRGR